MNTKYILYVKSGCPFCEMASELLKEKGKNFSTLNLKTRPKVLQEMKDIYEWSTVPMIFAKNGKQIEFIGGFSDLTGRLSDG